MRRGNAEEEGGEEEHVAEGDAKTDLSHNLPPSLMILFWPPLPPLRARVMRYCGDIEGQQPCQIVTLSAAAELISHHFFVKARLVVAPCE